jgi:hypothetical protein
MNIPAMALIVDCRIRLPLIAHSPFREGLAFPLKRRAEPSTEYTLLGSKRGSGRKPSRRSAVKARD